MQCQSINLKTLLKSAGRGYVSHIWLFLKIILPFFIPYCFVSHFLWGYTNVFSDFLFRQSENTYFLVVSMLNGVLWAAIIFVYIALVMALGDIQKNKRVSLKEIYADAARVFCPYVWLKIQCVFKVFLRTILLVVPGIFAATQYSCAGFAFLIDGKNYSDSFEYSRRLVKPFQIKYLDYLFWACVLLFAIVSPVVYILEMIIALFVINGSYLIADCLDKLQMLAVLMAGVYLTVFHYQLYLELKERFDDHG